jgi:hypothetical protein
MNGLQRDGGGQFMFDFKHTRMYDAALDIWSRRRYATWSYKEQTMHRIVIAACSLVVLSALAGLPANASADQTETIFGTCTLTAYSPTVEPPAIFYSEEVSCSGQNYAKRDYVCLYQLVSGGWEQAPNSNCTHGNANPWDSWTGSNPDLSYLGPWTTCVPGRWYATTAAGEINDFGTVYETTANTFNSGTQCT